MSDRLPSVDIFRSVSNIGEEDVAYIERDAILRSSQDDPARIRRVFASGFVRLPARALIIGRGELMSLQRKTGQVALVDQEHIVELVHHVQSKLPQFSEEPLAVPILPSKVHNDGGLTTLTVASGLEVTQERILAKQAVHDFYELDSEPEDVWLDDEYMASVRLMRGRKAMAAKIMKRLNEALQAGANLLPSEALLDPVDVRFSQ